MVAMYMYMNYEQVHVAYKTLLNWWESGRRKGGALQVRVSVFCASMMKQSISPVQWLWDRRLATPSKLLRGSRLTKSTAT